MAALTGDYIKAHRAGCKVLVGLPFADEKLADIVITCPGFPRI